MIYTDLTINAMRLAYSAHNGQLDKAGLPYIFHPYHLAEQMTDEVSTCVALLHDVVEDTNVSLEDLKKEFPTEVVDGSAPFESRPLLHLDKQYAEVAGVCQIQRAGITES